MGNFVNSAGVKIIAWIVSLIIVGLNAMLVYQQIHDWTDAAGEKRWIVLATVLPISLALIGLLIWMMMRKDQLARMPAIANADDVADSAANILGEIRRVGVALEALASDSPMLSEAITAAKMHRAELILMHIVEGVGGQYHGPRADDAERRGDDRYMHELAARLKNDLASDLPGVRTVLGYGNVQREIIRIAKQENLDMLILGGHGHRGLSDLIRGTTIDGVRHNLTIPVLAVRSQKS